MKLRVKSTEVVEAHRWWQNGDHPKDDYPPAGSDRHARGPTEGALVRRYRVPGDGSRMCSKCGHFMHDHGWLESVSHANFPRDGIVVCPGEWVITTNDECSCHAVINHDTLLEHYVPMEGESLLDLREEQPI